ncbi:hypothetical protein ACLB2K_040410 [Fragaria x ananassa]
MQSVAARWRELKSLLTNVYIVPYLDQPEMLKYPSQDYKFINADHWTKRLQQYPVKMSCKTWVAARVTKEGKFADEETQKKAEEIIELKEKVSTGETSLSGYNDVLEKALGKRSMVAECEGLPALSTQQPTFTSLDVTLDKA